MKKRLPILAIITSVLASSQALALETSIERVGMVYTSIPLTTKFMRSNDTAIGFRFGQARFSTDRYGYLFTSFDTHPAMVEMEFRPRGRIGSMSLGLQEFKLNGISSLEKRYIPGFAGPLVGLSIGHLALGAAAVGGVAALASSSGDSSQDTEKTPEDGKSSSTTTDDDPNHDASDDVADDQNDDENHAVDDSHDDDHAESDDGSDDDSKG